VLLNGNPAVDIFNGVKLAIGGELGIGVGEEEWGSGEREVLEDFVSRTNGLIDLVVSRFGGVPISEAEKSSPKKSANTKPDTEGHSWLGSDQCPQPSDGVIFSGVGAISRPSLCQVSHWMEWIYRYGEAAYGVSENPSSIRHRKQRRRVKAGPIVADPPHTNTPTNVKSENPSQSGRTSPGIPPPLVVATPPASQAATGGRPRNETSNTQLDIQNTEDSLFGTEAFMKYLTLGYGSAWKFPSMTANGSLQRTAIESKDEDDLVESSPAVYVLHNSWF
jgi:hypothetical protein